MGDPRQPDDQAEPAPDAYRDYLSQSWWPLPSEHQPVDSQPPPHATHPPASQHPAPYPLPQYSQSPTPALPPVRRSAGAWRSVGIGALGLIGGFLAAIILQDLIGVALLSGGGGLPLAGALLIASLIPALSIIGAVVALVVDRSVRRGRERSGEQR